MRGGLLSTGSCRPHSDGECWENPPWDREDKGQRRGSCGDITSPVSFREAFVGSSHSLLNLENGVTRSAALGHIQDAFHASWSSVRDVYVASPHLAAGLQPCREHVSYAGSLCSQQGPSDEPSMPATRRRHGALVWWLQGTWGGARVDLCTFPRACKKACSNNCIQARGWQRMC